MIEGVSTNHVLEHARIYFDELNGVYNGVHKSKEDLFWATYMATSDDQAGFARAERAYKDFISDPDRLRETREHVARLQPLPASSERDALLHGLRGWLAVFEANIIDNPDGAALMREIIEAEAVLFAKHRDHQPRHINERGESEAASLGMLSTNLLTNPVEEYRRSSLEGLRDIERWVLDNGFLDLVRLRNRFARAVGFSNYFDLKLRKNE